MCGKKKGSNCKNGLVQIVGGLQPPTMAGGRVMFHFIIADECPPPPRGHEILDPPLVITGLNKLGLRLYVLALKMASDTDWT